MTEKKPTKKQAASDKPVAHAPGTERLQVAMAKQGVASRRGVVSMIEDGLVTVNGKVVKEKGFRVDPLKDVIVVDGTTLDVDNGSRDKRYFLFYKPKGVMTTMQDPNAESIVADFFKDVPARVFPVGRLDRDTTGLLLVTNDGDLAFRLTHPKFGVEKVYRARIKGDLADETVKRLQKGVFLEEDGMTAPCKITVQEKNHRETIATVVMHEGKKRQIRRIFQKVGHYVIDLERLEFGPLTLGTLRPGQKRELTSREVAALEEATGIRKASKVPKEPKAPKPASSPARLERKARRMNGE
jgi:23S rRNA pseudouridine2605 synthase